jgi:GNAT superfamily N-acetyltransferase
VGYVAFDVDTVHHLGVVPQHTRRGYGSALLEFACMEIYAERARRVLLGAGRQSCRSRLLPSSRLDRDRSSGGPRSTRRIRNPCR